MTWMRWLLLVWCAALVAFVPAVLVCQWVAGRVRRRRERRSNEALDRELRALIAQDRLARMVRGES